MDLYVGLSIIGLVGSVFYALYYFHRIETVKMRKDRK